MRVITTIFYIFLSMHAFFNAIDSSLVDQMKRIPKVELHLHLGGSWPIEYLEKIAEPSQFITLSQMLDRFEQGMNYHEAFQVFDLVAKIVNTDKKVEDGVVALCKSLSDDGVSYVEIRTGLKDLGSGLKGYLDAILRGVERGCVNTDLKVFILLSVRRDTPFSVVQQTINYILHYRNRGVIGLDVSGISTQGNGDGIFQAVELIAKNNIPITVHMGESPSETAETQMKELQLLHPKRIGHGVHLCTQAVQWILDKKIPVELCLTSAVKVGMIEHNYQHPALQLLKDNHPVLICTDDPLIFRTILSEECAQVMRINNLTKNEMIQLQESAKNYCFK